MAGDWIKMRVSITRDPRVIRMADWLAGEREFMDWLTDPVRQSCKDTAYSHVTRHVTVALCVTALLVTWGTAREQGDRDGEDLVLTHCDLDTISAMSDLPRFGHAMSFVGWAIEVDGAVMFPKFFRDNESPDEKHKRQAAERQARKRERDRLDQEKSRESNATSHADGHVTVTDREEKRREEKKEGAPVASLPSCVPADAWSAFVEMRKKIKKPMTARAVELMFAKLERFAAAGHDVKATLEKSTLNCWQDVFEPKEGAGQVQAQNRFAGVK
jgi:hypothetical protein